MVRQRTANPYHAGSNPVGVQSNTIDPTFQCIIDSTTDQTSLAIQNEIGRLEEQAKVLLRRGKKGLFDNWQTDIGDELIKLESALERNLHQLDIVNAEFDESKG